MTDLQLKILNQIDQHPNKTIHFMEWAVQGVTSKDVSYLANNGFVTIQIGDGYLGGLRTLRITPMGKELLKDYCDCCECLPCDCGYGS